MRKFSQRSLNNLKGVHPDLVRVMTRALQESPVDFIVIEGVRSKERQEELFKKGATKTMNSRHLTGHAVDLLPIGPNGAEFAWPLYNKLAPAVKKVAKEEGVEIQWGGDWRTFKDGPHFELTHAAYPASEWTTGQKPPKEKKSVSQSTTVQASAAQLGTAAATAGGALAKLDGTAQIVALAIAAVFALLALYIMRERIRKWRDGVK